MPAPHTIQEQSDGYIVVYDDKAIRSTASTMLATSGDLTESDSILEYKAAQYQALKREINSRLVRPDIVTAKDYSHLPLSFVRVTSKEALQALRAHPGVSGVFENARNQHFLAESLPLVRQTQSQALGYTGAGATVAVIDTGTDYSDPAFGSCTAPGVPANCKVVVEQFFAANSSAPDYHGHGTNVAGIVVGVAPAAKIAALHVFNSAYNVAFDSDILAAINWCIANKSTYNIVAMNMSLGNGASNSAPVSNSVYLVPFANARAAGILPVAASGNNNYVNGISAPAAVVGAISVGAAYDSNLGLRAWSTGCTDTTTAADQVTCFSNSASFLSFIAPGSVITATGRSYSGTSQAAPHVAGAVAVLRAAYPTETLDQTVSRMTYYGKPVRDGRNGIIKPRVDLLAAASESLSCIGSMLSPESQIVGSDASAGALAVTSGADCTWNASSDVSWIEITSGSGTGNGVVGWTVTANGSGSTRTGTISVAGRSFTVRQTGVGAPEVFPPYADIPEGWLAPIASSAPWAVSAETAHEGFLSLKSGTILDGQKSQIQFTGVFQEGRISFARKVSSEPGFDKLVFSIDGVRRGQWSGEKEWATVDFNLTAGTHTLLWSYEKDSYNSTGSDAAWIDVFTATPGTFPPECTLQASPNSIAPGESSSLTAVCSPAANSYSWANAGFGSASAGGTVTPSQSTRYSVVGSNAGGSGNSASATVTVSAAPTYIYAAMNSLHAVWVFDAATNAFITSIPVGAYPLVLTLNPSGKRAYVANYGDDNVSVIDTINNVVVATIAVGSGPNGIALNHAGTRVYVANQIGSSISVIDTGSNAVIATIPVAYPGNIALTPDGSKAFVQSVVSPFIYVIDTASNTLASIIQASDSVGGLAVNPSGTQLFATGTNNQMLQVIDIETNSIIGRVAGKGRAWAVAFNSAGTLAYVTDSANSSLFVIDTADLNVIATVPVGTYPKGVSVNPAGTRVYVVNQGSGTLSVIDSSNHAVSATLDLGSYYSLPYNVAVGAANAPVCLLTSSPAAIARGETAVLSVTCRPAAASFVWSSNAEIDSASDHGTVAPIATTTYSVSGVNQSGAGAAASTTVMVNSSPIPACALSPASPSTVTFGASVTFTASCTHGPNAYVWKVDGVIDPAANQATYSTSNRLNAGPHTISMFASNTYGSSPEVPTAANLTVMPAKAAPFAYVSNSDGNSVSVFDTAQNTLVATVPVGLYPAYLAVHPAGTRVYVVNTAQDSVSVINTAGNTVMTTIPVTSPNRISINAPGTRVYVASYDYYNNRTSLVVIDTVSNSVVANIHLARSFGWMAIHPAANKLYITNYSEASISIIDLATNALDRIVPLAISPWRIVFNPQGTRIYVEAGQNIAVLDPSNFETIATVAAGSNSIYDMAADPTGARIYIANCPSSDITALDALTNTLIPIVQLGGNDLGNRCPYSITISPDGNLLYAAHPNRRNVSVVDLTTNTLAREIYAPDTPIFVRLAQPGTPLASAGNANTPNCTLSATPDAITAGGTVILTATCNPAATSFAWTNTGFDAVATSGTITQNVTTTYSVRGTNSNGSGNTASVKVVATPPPAPACMLSPVSPIIALGTQKAFSASCNNHPTSYRWKIDGIAQPAAATAGLTTPSDLGLGFHTVTVSASNFGGTSTPVTTTVQVMQAPTCSLTASPRVIRPGQSSMLSVVCNPLASSYEWSANTGFGSSAGSGMVAPAASTYYSVKGSNAVGAGQSASASVIVLTPGQRAGANAAILNLLLD